ncbi:MAG: hypothetical protein R3C18_25920 [Planctomycetaceae bacterium]
MSGSDSDKEKQENYSFIKWTIIGVLACYVLFAFAPFGIVRFMEKFSSNELGDSFGMANAFFSAAALAGVILALHFQRKELSAQREEMELQRHEMIEMQRVQLMQVRLNYLVGKGEKVSEWEKQEIAEMLEFIDRHVCVYMADNEIMTFEEMRMQISSALVGILACLTDIESRVRHLQNQPIESLNEASVVKSGLTKVTQTISRVERYAKVKKLPSDARRTLKATRNVLSAIRSFFPSKTKGGNLSQLGSKNTLNCLKECEYILAICAHGKNEITTQEAEKMEKVAGELISSI